MAIYDGHPNRRLRLQELYGPCFSNTPPDVVSAVHLDEKAVALASPGFLDAIKAGVYQRATIQASSERTGLFMALCLYPTIPDAMDMMTLKRVLSQRFSLSQKVPHANTVGLLLDASTINQNHIDTIKSVCRRTGKNLALLSIGILSEAKLANFPSIDLFVTIDMTVPDVISTAHPILNLYEFVCGCTDSFFAYRYGDIGAALSCVLEYFEDTEEDSSIHTVSKCSFYGLDSSTCSSHETSVVVEGKSGWSRTYASEASLMK